jgi:hypothetical protein
MALTLDDNSAALATVLRQAEVAGHQPLDVLTNAITERELGNARSIASVLHHRITGRVDLEPKGRSHTDWTPKVADPAYQRHLDDLAAVADGRRDQLGELVAIEAPDWAVKALGPVPASLLERDEWTARAGVVAAHRERSDHTDSTSALPSAPPRSRVEEYASWRASYRALGSPEDTRIERELSDGALRVAVRAYERELAWAPPYVAKDAAGTSRAAQDARTDAVLLELQGHGEEAAEAQQRADELARQAAELVEAGNIRGRWFMETLETKHHADRAREELTARRIDPDALDERVTAQEWLAAHREDHVVEDPHRVITEKDVADNTDEVVDDRPVMVAEMPLPDIRERVEVEDPVEANTKDWDRVPDMDTTRAVVDAAARALEEMAQRQAWEDVREAEDHSGQMATWQAADQVRADTADQRVDVLE